MAAITLTGPASVSESAGVATYTVTCGGDVPDVLAVTIAVDPGPAPPATEGDDYTAPTVVPIACLALVPSQQAFQVPIVNDTVDETTESFTVTSATLGQSVETAIVDDDPVASATPVVFVTEGDSGAQMANMVVTLASAAVQTTTIGYETVDSSATAGSDYTATSGSLVFQVGDLTKTISVPVIGDTTPEKPEAFFVNLLTTDNGSLDATKKQTAVGIFDTDTAPLPTVSLPRGVSVKEGNTAGNILFDVKLSSPAAQRTEVGWKTTNGTAKKSDYDSAHGKLVFHRGQKSKTISIDVKGDRRDEPDEAFVVELRNPVAATLGAQKASVGVIEDDDGPKMRIGKPRLRGERLIAKVACPASADSCTGKLVGKSRGLKLGRERFDLDGGEAKKLKLKLSDQAQAALSETRRRRAKLKATASDSSGDRRVTTRKIRLKRLR
jgi:hypothetical protein